MTGRPRLLALALLTPWLGMAGCVTGAPGPKEAAAAHDRTEMQHVFRVGEAESAQSKGDHRGAFTGYHAFLESCESDPRSEVCARYREEAMTGIAEALAHLDIDASTLPLARGKALLDRVHDRAWIGDPRSWTLGVHAAAWRAIQSDSRLDDVLSLGAYALEKWPSSLDAPIVAYHLAAAWTAVASAPGTLAADRTDALRKAASHRGLLARCAFELPDTGAPSRTPHDLALLRDLLRASLRDAAEDRHRQGERLERALPWLEGVRREDELLRAAAEFSAAAAHWDELLSADDKAPDASDIRARVAEEQTRMIALRVRLGRTPPPNDVAAARRAAAAACARASPDVAPRACQIGVDLARRVIEDQTRQYQETAGRQGISIRDEVQVDSSDPERTVIIKNLLPRPVLDLIAALDDYLAHVSPEAAGPSRIDEYRLEAAEYHFFYGELGEARKRLQAMHLEGRGQGKTVCRAWDRLLTIEIFESDIAEIRRIDQVRIKVGCPVPPWWQSEAPVVYGDAGDAFSRAQRVTDPLERRRAFLMAAELYEAGFLRLPEIEEAAEAGLNGAYAYKQGGRLDKAIRLYELFVAAWTSERKLSELHSKDRRAYADRLKYLKMGFDALAAAHILDFDYTAAALAWERIARFVRFTDDERRDAAINAAIVRAALGDDMVARADATTALLFHPGPRDTARLDFYLAAAGLDPVSPPAGTDALREQRKTARRALEKVVKDHERQPEAAPYVLRAAYRLAQLATGEDAKKALVWCKKVEDVLDASKHPADKRSPASGAAKRKNGAPPSDEAKDSKAPSDDPMGREEAAMAADCASRRTAPKKAPPAAGATPPPRGKTLAPPFSSLEPPLPVVVSTPGRP